MAADTKESSVTQPELNTSPDTNATTETSESPDAMRAWIYTKAGINLAKALTLVPNARRPPQPLPADKVLVRVTHTSLNPADYKIPELGRLASYMLTRSTSATPGMDFAGVVEAVPDSQIQSPLPASTSGKNLNNTLASKEEGRYKVGDKVFGHVTSTPFGTLGTYVQPSLSSIVPLPPNVSTADASTLGTAAATAYQAIYPYVTPNAETPDEVFINGGSGGVGTFAIQIAAHVLGCKVTTSCSARNIELCKSLGADEVIDYTTSPAAVLDALRARGKAFKLVVDNVASRSSNLYEEADSYMVPEGTYIQVGGGFSLSEISLLTRRALLPGFLTGGKKKRKFKFIVLEEDRNDLVKLGQWMEEGKIRAVIDGDIFAFEDAPKAFEKLKTGRTSGKLIVKVSE